jgi:hypothetical protein
LANAPLKDPTAVRPALAMTIEGVLIRYFLVHFFRNCQRLAKVNAQVKRHNAAAAFSDPQSRREKKFCTCVVALHKEIVRTGFLRIL